MNRTTELLKNAEPAQRSEAGLSFLGSLGRSLFGCSVIQFFGSVSRTGLPSLDNSVNRTDEPNNRITEQLAKLAQRSEQCSRLMQHHQPCLLLTVLGVVVGDPFLLLVQAGVVYSLARDSALA